MFYRLPDVQNKGFQKSLCAISEHLNFMAKSTLNKVIVLVGTSQIALPEQPGVHEDFLAV